MDSENVQEAEITAVDDAKVWAQVLVEEGEVVEILHNELWDKFDAMSEAVVVKQDGENVFQFMDYNMMVLVAHTQKTIDDIVEAYLFRELHDMAY
jgi:hypothetical protein